MVRNAVGIDLGTTYSCVAVMKNENVEIVANENGNRTTASYVAFTDTERYVGDAAKNQVALNPNNTVYDSKRIIGKQFDDESVQNDMEAWPFKIINDEGLPKIEVQYQGECTTYTPEEISSIVLMHMKEVAESFVMENVKDVVLTVPVYFNDSQRQATKIAGKLAGLNVLQIINEPTAAAIAYGFHKVMDSKKNLLIFDLGGGTFDVSILTALNGEFSVRSTHGDSKLGGEDFDNRMVTHFINEFRRKHKQDLSVNKRSMHRLTSACELAKRSLTNNNQANLQLDSLFDGIDFYTNITRARFEELNGDLFRITIDAVEKVIEDAGMDKSEIDEVILVGGSSRIPKVQKLLQEFFDGKELCKSISPDEAVAYGAAVQAALLSGDISDSLQDLIISDAVSLSLGLATSHGSMDILINRNTSLPAKRTKIFTTTVDNQQAVMIEVYEGDRPLVKNNNILCKFELTGIPPAPRGVPQIEVTFDVDIDGILSVTAVDNSTGKVCKVDAAKSRLTQEDISKKIAVSQECSVDDNEILSLVKARDSLINYVYQIKLIIDENQLKSQKWEVERKCVSSKCNEVISWLETSDSNLKEDFSSRYEDVRKVVGVMMKKMNI